MTTSYQNIRAAQENATLASYGWGIFSKGKKAAATVGYLCRDVIAISDSRISQMFMQLQAAVHMGGTSFTADVSSTCSASSYDPENLYHSFKESMGEFTKHPISVFAREFFFYKQTVDFGVAGYEWTRGNRSSSSLLHHGVNTALAYIPIMAATPEMVDSPPVQMAVNALAISCLAYSIRQDIRHSSNPGLRESSPSVSLVKDNVIPGVRALSQRLFG